jgi:hypothetical protein
MLSSVGIIIPLQGKSALPTFQNGVRKCSGKPSAKTEDFTLTDYRGEDLMMGALQWQ